MDLYDEFKRVLEESRTIAVIGASRDPSKAAHSIPSYIAAKGYHVIPVNPYADELFGERVYRSLQEIPEPVDMVDVFRPPKDAESVARAAVEIGAKTVWFQPGTATEKAAAIAREAGLTVIVEACLGVVHRQLAAELTPRPA